MGRASKDKRDIYYRRAKEEGYRARSAYKLLQIDEEFDLFNGVVRAVDLCAAPGSWSQVLADQLEDPGHRIVAVDLQEMAPIPGVAIVQGDITTVKTANEVISQLGDVKADIVVCDGAPDVTGLHELDEYMQHQLLLAALNITTFVLREGGTFVTKMFRGPNTPFLCAKSEIFFEHVTVVKPKSSRNASMESFLLCQNYRPPAGYIPTMVNPVTNDVDYFPNPVQPTPGQQQRNEAIWAFLACGDLSGFDSDMCYDRDANQPSLPPVAPPIEAPYLDDNRQKRQREDEEDIR